MLDGLRRSPRHWYDLVKKVFGSMATHPCPHSPCVFTGTPIPGQPPIYIAMYVNDMCYFSASDAVKQWFETTLQSNPCLVDLMGPAEWFLGTYYEWNVDPTTSDVSCHMSQTVTIDALLETNHMADCNWAITPYCTGTSIYSLASRETPSPSIIEKYQSLVGSLNWLSVSTRPDLSAVVSLLSSYLHRATSQHLDAACYVLRYLKGTLHMASGFLRNLIPSSTVLFPTTHQPMVGACATLIPAGVPRMPLSLPQPSHLFPFPLNPPALLGVVTALSARAVLSPGLLTRRIIQAGVPVRLKLLPPTMEPSKSSISSFSWMICISLMSLLPPQSTMTTMAVLTGLTNCVLSPPPGSMGVAGGPTPLGAGLSAGAPGGTHLGNITVSWSTTPCAGLSVSAPGGTHSGNVTGLV
jgi:hypothetical protein